MLQPLIYSFEKKINPFQLGNFEICFFSNAFAQIYVTPLTFPPSQHFFIDFPLLWRGFVFFYSCFHIFDKINEKMQKPRAY